MKKLLSTLVMFVACLLQAQTDTITILQVNDTHSFLAPLAPRTQNLQGTKGGIARAASVIGMAKATEHNVLAFHGGDMFIGDLFFVKYFGVPEMQILSSLGLDAMAVGNHEFDLQPQTLQGALDAAFPTGGFPLVSSNTILDGFPTLKNHVKPFITKTAGSIKVGIFGMTTPEANVFSLPVPVVIDTSLVPTMYAMVDTLKKLQCQLIICLSHLGIGWDKELAALVPSIDVIVSAHDHYLTPEPVVINRPDGGKTYITQCGSLYSHVGKLKLLVNSGTVTKLDFQQIELNDQVPEEPQVKAVVDGLIADIESVYGPLFTQQIGTAMADITESDSAPLTIGDHDTPFGNLITDAFRLKENTQIAIQVGGSTLQPLYHGPITAADAFRAIGYGFNTINGLGYHLVTCKISGLDLMKGLEFCLGAMGGSDELLPQVSGMTYKYIPSNNPGERVASVLIGGQPLSLTSYYMLTVNQFLLAALTDPGLVGANLTDIYIDTTTTEFQALVECITNLGILSPLIEGRVRAISPVKIEKNSDRPQNFELKQNYPNPFNPATTIRYTLQTAGHVSLKVYNITGQLVRTLVDCYAQPGDYKTTFEGRDDNSNMLGSGVYLYQLQSGNTVLSRKCILIK